MKALISETSGGPDKLRLGKLPLPVLGPGQLLVRIEACAINYPDALVIEDKYQFRPERPFAPGGEIAGVVQAVGPNVNEWKIGDRIIAATVHGGIAEYVSVPVEDAYLLPDDVPAVEGSTFLMTYATAMHALIDRGGLSEGKTLLVLGAAGGVGVAAIEIGKALGATVIAAVSSPEKAQFVSSVGADRTVIYDRGPLDRERAKALAQAFKDAVGGDGADVICDPVGGDYCDPALRSIAWGGRYLVLGFTAGIPSVPLNLALLKGCDISGVFWGSFIKRYPQRNRDHLAQLFRWWSEGKIRPRVEKVFPFEEGAEAISWLSGRRALGKVVVDVAGNRAR